MGEGVDGVSGRESQLHFQGLECECPWRGPGIALVRNCSKESFTQGSATGVSPGFIQVVVEGEHGSPQARGLRYL